ncbi:MAG: putative modified peptide [Gammaproteobacteria bacterium HGW-Gammaproteobacteria-4]|jgi:putative modified peptide|nr:MAG: putative modified peptide [Gammaproteobacteria bacterium HGW-Gammaproteobacteria-4]
MSNTCFTPEVVDTLLDKLSSDDQFREQFLGNPALVLHTLGVDVDPAQVPSVRRLPSKEVLKANREAIKAKLSGQVGLIIFLVE